MSVTSAGKLLEIQKKTIDALWRNDPVTFGPLRELLEQTEESAEIERAVSALQPTLDYYERCFQSCRAMASGDAVISTGTDEDVSAAALNAAAAGTFKRDISITVLTAGGAPHLLCAVPLVLTPGHTTADGDIGDPTLPATVTLDRGVAIPELVFDTDDGATKVYQIGDTVTGKAAFPADLWLNFAVAFATKTFTVIA